uniref:Uncharacterized protein n=1 Tax=Oryza glumipatula TaxID=40148 RepID=A0A0D9Z5M2_9ORYZ
MPNNSSSGRRKNAVISSDLGRSGPHPHTLPTSTCSTSPPPVSSPVIYRLLLRLPPLTTTASSSSASSSSSSSRLPALAVAAAARARVPVLGAHGSSPPACASDTGCEGVWKPADLGRSPPESGTGGGIQVADWVQHMLFLTLGV